MDAPSNKDGNPTCRRGWCCRWARSDPATTRTWSPRPGFDCKFDLSLQSAVANKMHFDFWVKWKDPWQTRQKLNKQVSGESSKYEAPLGRFCLSLQRLPLHFVRERALLSVQVDVFAGLKRKYFLFYCNFHTGTFSSHGLQKLHFKARLTLKEVL